MTTHRNIILATTRYIVIDLAGDVIYFPIWWFTVGLRDVSLSLYHRMVINARHLALRPLFINLAKPMFGQYDRAGRAISIFMRLVILIVRLMYFMILLIFLLLLLSLWIVIPIIISGRVWSVLFS